MTAPFSGRELAPVLSRNVSEAAAPHEADARAARTGRFRALLLRAASLPGAVLDFVHRRAVLAELGQLSDRELADIGLSRAELRRVFDPGFARARERARLA